MSLDAFVAYSADRHEGIEKLALSKLPDIQSRALDLYNNPGDRSDVLTKRYLFAGYQSMVRETGNEELAAAYWDQVSTMVDTSVDDLASTPVGDRGDVWATAMGIVLAVSLEQAQAESGITIEAAAMGAEMGNELNRVTRRMSIGALSGATYHIKTELEERKKHKNGSGG